MTSSRMASSKEGSAQKDFSKRGPFYASANTSQTTLDYQFPTDRHQRIRRGDDYRLSSRIQKVAEVNFLDDQVCGPFEMMMPLPDPDSDLGYLDEHHDEATKTEMNKIRKECHVFIVSEKEHIMISAFTFEDLTCGMLHVRELLAAMARKMLCRTVSLVQRTTRAPRPRVKMQPVEDICSAGAGNGTSHLYLVDDSDLPVVNGDEVGHGRQSVNAIYCPIQLKHVKDLGIRGFDQDRWRGVAKPQILVSESATDGDKDLVPLTVGSMSEAIGRAADTVCPVLGELRMRIQLGTLFLVKKRGEQEYDMTRDFKTLVDKAATNGYTEFHHPLGDETLTTRLLEHIYRSAAQNPVDSRFISGEYDADDLRQVKPKYCLIFWSGNRRVEIDVQRERADADLGAHGFGASFRLKHKAHSMTASTPRVYKSFKKSLVAEVVVACPDEKFDWHVVVESDIGGGVDGVVEQRFKNLAAALKFGDEPVNGFDFPTTEAPRSTMVAAGVDKVAYKVYWTFECSSSPYKVEVAVYHDSKFGFSTRLRDPKAPFLVPFSQIMAPIKACGVSLYGDQWDRKLRGMNPASGQFPAEFADLFSLPGRRVDAEGDHVSGVAKLLEEMEHLLKTTTSEATTTQATSTANTAGGPEQPTEAGATQQT